MVSNTSVDELLQFEPAKRIVEKENATRERKCLSRLDLRNYICGPRMRFFTTLKSIISISFAILLQTAITNFNIIESELNKIKLSKDDNNSENGSIMTDEMLQVSHSCGRKEYYYALWIAFIFCAVHFVACVVMILSSFCGKTRRTLAHMAFWLIFVLTAIIPITSIVIYFGSLPRAKQQTINQLIEIANIDYEKIIPLQEKFDCCSVDFVPDVSTPDEIKRFEPTNSNFSCAMREMYVVKQLPSPVEDSHVIFKSLEPKQPTCTVKIISYFPDKIRWLWILKAAAIPYTAFGWIVVFDLMFIITVWFDRGDDGDDKDEKEPTTEIMAVDSNGTGNNEQKRNNLYRIGNTITAEQAFVSDKANREKTRSHAADQEIKIFDGKAKKRPHGGNIAISIDRAHSPESEINPLLLGRRKSFPFVHDDRQHLFPRINGKDRALSNISERDTDVSASGSFSKSTESSVTDNSESD